MDDMTRRERQRLDKWLTSERPDVAPLEEFQHRCRKCQMYAEDHIEVYNPDAGGMETVCPTVENLVKEVDASVKGFMEDQPECEASEDEIYVDMAKGIVASEGWPKRVAQLFFLQKVGWIPEEAK